MKELIKAACPMLDAAQCAQMDAYFAMLLDWNTRMNLTAVTDPAEAAQKHFADSLTALPYLPSGAACIDVGTGAGFPGVPLLIARPDLSVTLLDGLNKRIVFLQAVCDALGLPARCIHARAEDAGRDPVLRGRFDIALSRAVAPLPVLLELTVPFLKVGGVSIAYKGDVSAELAASAHALDALHCAARREDVTGAYGMRTLVLAEKRFKTAPAYPRRAGTPEKKPL